MTSLLMIGFLIGMRHALEADHVAAVASLATKQQTLKQAMHQGMAWGLGHTITLFLIGSILLWMDTRCTRITRPAARISGRSDACAAR